MPTLVLRFPGGRYHATPWGHHVNEGLVEWPPSPWRVLRALIACGYTKLGWDSVPPVARSLIETLAGTLPHYCLPHASVAHSRHYMPTGAIEKRREGTTLVFDTWADVADGALAVRWNCTLDTKADRLFGLLATHLSYFGRSESWVLAESIGDDAALPPGRAAWPDQEGQTEESGWERVWLMAPQAPEIYRRWREQEIDKALQPPPHGKRKISKKLEADRAMAVALYPADLIDCLQRDTRWWKRHRWSQPPGSRRVLYWRHSDSFNVGAPAPPAGARPSRVTMMLLALTTPNGSRSSLPMRSRALPQAELLHRALVARIGHGAPIDCPELTGRNAAGRPLTDHRHAHHLPLDLDGDGHLDHVLIYAPMGLGVSAQHAIRTLKRTWTKGAVGELRFALAGQGGLDDLRRLPSHLQVGVAALLGPPEGARVWSSFTPLVLPRHLKRRGRNTLAEQVKAELACRGLPLPAVDVLPWDDQTTALRHTVRVRRYPAKPPPVDSGFAVRLRFQKSVSGPIALGYGSHYGLGLFVAAEDSGPNDVEHERACSHPPPTSDVGLEKVI